jgi:hypothetical protein
MPRQTSKKEIQFPDGFKLGIDNGNGFEDVGVLAGGATATMSWTDYHYDAGNYVDLVDKAKDPTIALAPSAILNWNPATIANLFSGFLKTDDGENLEYAGSDNQVTLARATVKLIHFSSDESVELAESDITALDESGTNNDLITVPKTTFSGALDWSASLIDGYVEIAGMSEVKASQKDDIASQGNFYTDATNLYFIVEAGTYGTLELAKTGLAGTEVKFYKAIDWQFYLYNAKVDAGASFNFKGANEDGLDEITVSFTGKPDPENSYRLFNLFKLT